MSKTTQDVIPDDTVDVVPTSFIDQLEARRYRAQLSLKLQRTYEFIIPEEGLPDFIDEKPIVHHSWTTRFRSTPPSEKTKRYPLTRDANFNIDLPIGVTAVLGRSGAGKSRLVFDHLFVTNNHVNHDSVRYIKMFEPGDDERVTSVSRRNTYIPMFEAELAADLAFYLFNPETEVIVIDSLRYLFYSSAGGATGKGGVNMSLFMDLTHLDSVATALGKRVVVVINPMTDDELAFNFYVEAAAGAVSGVVVMKDYVTASITQRYAPTRESVSFKVPKTSILDNAKGVKLVESEEAQRVEFKGGKPNNLSNDLFDRG